MQKIVVALVEDDLDLAEEIAFQLECQEMFVEVFDCGQKLDAWLKTNKCDVVLLDLNLPDEDGLSIAKRLSQRADLRIIMLTARVMTDDRIAGFEAGADVYLSKPVVLPELIAIIRRLTKRLPELEIPWQLSPEKALLISPTGIAMKLTTNEVDFLKLLHDAENNYLSRDELEQKLWGVSDVYMARRLDVLVSRLRQKLTPFEDEIIQTYWRKGYGLKVSIDI